MLLLAIEEEFGVEIPDQVAAEILTIDDEALSLARHGVTVEAATDHREHMNVGQAILKHARELHADALVMGCFGHSRFRESILGGASPTVLSETTLPVLMSH